MATDVPSFVVQQPLLVQESYRNELKETLRARAFWARPVVLKLKRPVVARIATLPERPLILIDLHPEEGVIGRSYLEPYIRELIGYLILALYDLGEMFKRRRLAPIEFSKSRPQVATLRWLRRHVDDRCCRPRYGGRDALARAAGVPVCALLGRSIGPVSARNSNGLRLRSRRNWRARRSSCARMAGSMAFNRQRQWENPGAPHARATRAALRVEPLPLPVKGSLGRRSQSSHPNRVWSAYRFRIGASKPDRQSSERDDTRPRQRPCSNC